MNGTRRIALSLALVAILATSAQPATGQDAGLQLSASGGTTNYQVLGLDAGISYSFYTNQQGVLLGRFGLGLAAALLDKAKGGDPPCPPNADPPCPDGNDWITSLVGTLNIADLGPVSLVGHVGGGLAFGSAAEREGQVGTGKEARTAPALRYGVGLELPVNESFGITGTYSRFSIFTGERNFTGPNGTFTADVGTETKSLLAAGVYIRF